MSTPIRTQSKQYTANQMFTCAILLGLVHLASATQQIAIWIARNDPRNLGILHYLSGNGVMSLFNVTYNVTLDPESCLLSNGEGRQCFELTCLYPMLRSTYMTWETRYDSTSVSGWMESHSFVPIVAVVLYGIAILAGKAYFANRERWNWRYTLAAWNFGLSLFSFIGMSRTLPHLLHMLGTLSPKETICCDPIRNYGGGSTGLWVQLFILSKFPELLDTFFIVIHKKKLIFLHWYHHITVLLYCWHAYVTHAPHGLFFVVMNYTVHATMYGYYCLTALCIRPKWFNPMIVTAMQISQMIVGVAISLAAFYYKKMDPECSVRNENNTAAFVMYGSYLLLFVEFFVERYLQQRKRVKNAMPVSCDDKKIDPERIIHENSVAGIFKYGSYLSSIAAFFVERYMQQRKRVKSA